MPEPLTDRVSQSSLLRGKAERAAGALPPLLVAAERLASTVALGVHGRRKAGMGETFWQFRRYRTEDPAGAIDWRQSARSQHLFVREREWEAAEAVWFWRDGSAGMRFSSLPEIQSKVDRASLLSLALCSLLVRGGERIALLGEGRLPSSGRATLNRIGHSLAEILADEALPPDARMTRNGHFVWLSDFLSPFEEIEKVLRRLASNGLHAHLVHIVDPAEEDFPFAGRTRFETADGRLREIFGRAESVREEYRARFKAHSEGISDLARRLGFFYLAHRTDHRPELALIALYAALGGPRALTAQR
ncbi:MAG TPA: DUF58 domain-containing protein [Rhizomicrobium sp.]|nr:DUF58 domain-containing protein [Rhizomicrobium sp.]